MTILLTGSQGKTTRPLSLLLSASNHEYLIASRCPPPSCSKTVTFDWTDPSTYQKPFSHPLAVEEGIDRVWIVGADIPDISMHVMNFTRFAREKGVKRFVMLSAWEVGAGDEVLMGRVHGELERLGREEGVEWIVLRANYFMDNFLNYYLPSIKKNGVFYSASGPMGKKAFIDARDIAGVAYHALVDVEMERNREYFLTGPESLSDVQVADTISRLTGRDISCTTLDDTSFREKLIEAGIEEWMATYLAKLDLKVAKEGGSGPVSDSVRKITGGKEPRSLEDFVREHREKFLI